MTVEPAVAWVASPVQWSILALVLLLVFAPSLFPVLARKLGWRLSGWLRGQTNAVPASPQRSEAGLHQEEDVVITEPMEHRETEAWVEGSPAVGEPLWPSLAKAAAMLALLAGLLWVLLRSR